jgi:hypothetical protein
VQLSTSSRTTLAAQTPRRPAGDQGGPDRTVTFRATCVLRWNAGPDVEGRAGFIDKGGKVWLSGAATSARNRHFPEAGDRYLAAVASEIGGIVRRYDNQASPEVMDATGHAPDLTLMLDHGDTWRSAIALLIEESRDPDA